MSQFTAIDLSKLPAPNVVEALDYEHILEGMYAELATSGYQDFLESDPIVKLVQLAAATKLNLIAKVNDSALGTMLAHAQGSDLDNVYPVWVQREVLIEEDLSTDPPTEKVMENDESLRKRKQLAQEGYSTAGPIGAYTFFCFAASAQVKDVDVLGPDLRLIDNQLVSINGVAAGTVKITILSTLGNGVPDQPLLDRVSDFLSKNEVRPLCELPILQAAEIIKFDIVASLEISDAPSKEEVRKEAEKRVRQYALDNHGLGKKSDKDPGKQITRSGLYAALHVPGVINVNLIEPSSDIGPTRMQAAFAQNISITVNNG